jgi:acetylornithine deacetylase/succinyl-diaminopimelate desuccinylase-like protein
MDTVYLRGMLEDQPFCIDGERAYGLAIADDKQGVVLILHTAAMLQWLPSPKCHGTRNTSLAPIRAKKECMLLN